MINKFTSNGKKIEVVFKKYYNLQKSADLTKDKLFSDIDKLLKNTWGTFPADFVFTHILTADKILIAMVGDNCIGFCVTNIKTILNLKINYVEFLIVGKEFQKSKIGSYLFFISIKEEIYGNFLRLVLGGSLEIAFITPNIRTLSHMARFASFIYPNPYLANKEGYIHIADEDTWVIANEILKNSDYPNRKLDRNGLVLHQSYVNTPWLIYNNDNAPWHGNENINLFVRRYLGYHTGEDREFIVRARINIFSFLRYLLYV